MKIKHVCTLGALLIALNLFVCWYLYQKALYTSATPGQAPKGIRKRILHRRWHDHCVCAPLDFPLLRLSKSSTLLMRSAQVDHESCLYTSSQVRQHTVDVQTHRVLEEMRIRYPQWVYTHSGWIQEWHITYSSAQWDQHPLTVIVVPFSHNDPGWLFTYESYFNTWTSATLTKVVEHLSADATLTFVWSEITYLALWYTNASPELQKQFLGLLERGQFEIVTGGWVMSDEAVSHYAAMLDQLVEGHQWLHQVLGYTPENAWALDPFGHSPTMAYLLRSSGISNMLIQRVHYAIKQHLGTRKQLEFYWKQTWDQGRADTGIFCHLTPFMLYAVRYSCGPDTQVCCQYDFGHKGCWRWGKYVETEAITTDNIRSRAWDLLDQYRKKAQLFKSNVLLVLHGDDFRYSTSAEFDEQFGNLKKLFSFMNKEKDMNIQIKFGTLKDYFHAASEDLAKTAGEGSGVPSLSGDFFTYNDRDDQYWSGYFSSRPFLKAATRRLQAQLRAAEILFTLGTNYVHRHQVEPLAQQLKSLQETLEGARHTSGLLQHHDAITGTARATVVEDYLQKLWEALRTTETTITIMAATMLNSERKAQSLADIMDMAESSGVQPGLPLKKMMDLSVAEKLRLVVFHPLPTDAQRVVTVRVNSPYVQVADHRGRHVSCQINPVWMGQSISTTSYEVAFQADLSGLSLMQYFVELSTSTSPHCYLATVSVVNAQTAPSQQSVFQVIRQSQTQRVAIHNWALSAYFCSCTGLLQSVITKQDDIPYRAEVRFVHYGTGSWNNPFKDKSGAYIFMPDGHAQEVSYETPTMLVLQGPVMSSVTTILTNITQTITLLNSTGVEAGCVHLDNWVDIRGSDNTELAMRLLTDINNAHGHFFTDLNGFQVHRRKRLARLTLQGNFYPMTTMLYVEDQLFRVTLHSAQSHGVSSLNTGWLEAVLDRRLMQDDWRGLSEGVLDNRLTHSRFSILMEARRKKATDTDNSGAASFPSLLSHLTSDQLNNPMVVLYVMQNHTISDLPVEPLSEALPCDLALLNLKTLQTYNSQSQVLLQLHRRGIDCAFTQSYGHCSTSLGQIKWTTLFSQMKISNFEECNLTGVKVKVKPHRATVYIPPMEIKTYKVTTR